MTTCVFMRVTFGWFVTIQYSQTLTLCSKQNWFVTLLFGHLHKPMVAYWSSYNQLLIKCQATLPTEEITWKFLIILETNKNYQWTIGHVNEMSKLMSKWMRSQSFLLMIEAIDSGLIIKWYKLIHKRILRYNLEESNDFYLYTIKA